MLGPGILLIDKPVGITSFDVIRKLRKITGIRKMGHTGTLDPFASGLLIICLGKATRISSKIIAENKQYTAKMRLGLKTDTGDMTGKVVQEIDTGKISSTSIQDLIPEILAIRQQIPHRYSAIKVSGKKAYELARQKAQFQLPTRPIEIKSFVFEKIDLPDITYRTTVSKGTYIRVLSETIAEMLNNIAVTTELRRTAIGKIGMEKACQLADLNSDNWQENLYPIINLFTECVRVGISEERRTDFKQGRRFRVEVSDNPEVIVSCGTEMLGFGEIEKGILKPRIVLI